MSSRHIEERRRVESVTSQQRLMDAINGTVLKPRERQVLTLKIFDDLSHYEIADRLSSMYATMGAQELSHVDTLHEQAVRLIQAQRAEGKEVPAGMQAVWDWEHSHMMDRVARIKVLLDTARR